MKTVLIYTSGCENKTLVFGKDLLRDRKMGMLLLDCPSCLTVCTPVFSLGEFCMLVWFFFLSLWLGYFLGSSLSLALPSFPEGLPPTLFQHL